MTPVTFHGCFGWLHEATADFGVVLCGADGVEALTLHRLWLHFAEGIASAGIPTLRFDYPGTGDSLDNDGSAGQVRAWIESIAAAVNWMKNELGLKAVALIGIRLGATLAAAASKELDGIAALVLMAPIVLGRTYTRELRMNMKLYQSLGRARGRSKNAQYEDLVINGGVQAGGFIYTSETLADLERLNLLTGYGSPSPHILILNRDLDKLINKPLAAHFRTLGVEVSEDELVGYFGSSPVTEHPRAATDRVTSWLNQSLQSHAAIAPLGARPAQLEQSDYVEEPISFGHQLSLFGVLCRPTSVRLDAPVLLLLPSWPRSHIGYGRMWVTMARDLARLGFASLRFDVAGIGDSSPELNKNDISERPEDSMGDVRAALDWLQNKGHSRFVIIGFCWGALLARLVSIDDERVSGQILIYLPLEIETVRHYFQLARTVFLDLDPRNWLPYYRRDKKITLVIKRLACSGIRCATLTFHAVCVSMWQALVASNVRDKAWQDLLKFKVDTLLLYSNLDNGVDELRSLRSGAARETKAQIAILEDADTGDLFFWQPWRRRLTNLVGDYLTNDLSLPNKDEAGDERSLDFPVTYICVRDSH